MRRLWIAVLPATAILLLTAPCAFTSGAEEGREHGKGPAKGGPERLPNSLRATPDKAKPSQEKQLGENSDPWGFMGPLLPAVRAIGDIFKPIISGSNLEQDLEDIMAALNETSHNPFFLFGLDDTPPKTAPAAATHSKRHSVVPQRQQLNASKGQHTSSHTSQPKKKGSSIGPLRGLFGQDQGASATPSGPAEGVPPRRTPEREHHAGQSDEEEEESLWRQWNNEDLELL